MKLVVIGKRHCSGTAKATGKPFDFIEIHYNGKDRYGQVEGQVGKKFTMNPGIIDYSAIQVGALYDTQFDDEGVCIGMTPCK